MGMKKISTNAVALGADTP